MRLNSINLMPYSLSLCPSALTSISELRGLKTQSTNQEDKVVPLAPAQCTTWHTGCTNSAINIKLGMPQLTRSVHRDMAGGVDPFQRNGSHCD